MRHLFLLAFLAFVIAGVGTRYADRAPELAKAAARPAAVPEAKTPPVSAGPRTVTIRRDDHGHFRVPGVIDGRRMGFMVDTGASVVALNEREASRIGIHPAQREYVAQVSTANGTVRAARTRLASIEIGGIVVRNVDALVLPNEALSENLLGMSFLSRLRRWEYSGGRLILEE